MSAYTHIVSSADFLKMQQALFLDLLACIQHHGAEWSFPSHNVYLNREGTERVGSQNQNNNQNEIKT